MRTVFVHGFTQTAASWGPVIDHLGPEIEPLALEVPDDLDFVEAPRRTSATPWGDGCACAWRSTGPTS
jgi:hypothetical protein